MNILKKYQEYAISIVGRKNGYITQAEREKARKRIVKRKRKIKRNRTMTSAVYCNKELSLALQKKDIEAHRVMKYEKGGGWYYHYTYDIICRWLREVHGLHIYTFCLGEKWHYEIQVFKEWYTYSKVGGDSHDEAVEAAIWYCINILI